MRPSNIVTEAGVQTRMRQWWDGIPFLTSTIVIICGTIYLVCLLIGYDSFEEVCFLPSAIVSRFGVYRIYTSILFHGSLLHVMFNMLALVPLGSELERIMGSIRLSYMIVLLATSNAILHLLIALVASHNPFYYPMNECTIGFSGILFSMIVIETSLSGVQSRSVFGLFNVPAKWYAFILLALFQLLMTNVSLLGHLCGILSGFAYTYGLFNFLMPRTSFYSAIESSSWLGTSPHIQDKVRCPVDCCQAISGETCLRGCHGGKHLHNYKSGENYGFDLSAEDSRFPGRGRTLGSTQSQMVPAANSDSNLQARLLDPDHSPDLSMAGSGERQSDGRSSVDNTAALPPRAASQHQDLVTFDQHVQKLVSMGFEKTQVEVALAAADGNLNVAVEILMSQQG